jgi:hypothetical protein
MSEVLPDAGAPAQESAPEPVVTTPEVTEPEAQQQEPEAVEKPEEDPRDKTVKAMERRIARLTAAKYESAAKADAALREAEQWRQRVSQYEAPQDQQPQQVDPVALASEIASIREVTAKSNQVFSEGSKRFGKDTFGKSVSTLIDEAGPLVVPVAPGASVGRPTPLGEAILAADDPAAVMQYLGANPEIAAELSGLSVVQAARKVARIESDLAKPKEPKVSNAAKPVIGVKGSAKDDGGLSDDLPMSEWTKRFNKMMATR